jgi:sorting nexin-9/18/33
LLSFWTVDLALRLFPEVYHRSIPSVVSISMTTLPRSAKNPSASSMTSQRPQSEFDAGINTSAAWTEHLETESGPNDTGSLSDEEPDEGAEESRPARALYDFEGKSEFRELSVVAGDDLEVIKEDLADGWSLVKNSAGEVGLLPQTYYTVRPSLYIEVYLTFST